MTLTKSASDRGWPLAPSGPADLIGFPPGELSARGPQHPGPSLDPPLFLRRNLQALSAGGRCEDPMAAHLFLYPVLQAVREWVPGMVKGMEEASVGKADEDMVT